MFKKFLTYSLALFLIAIISALVSEGVFLINQNTKKENTSLSNYPDYSQAINKQQGENVVTNKLISGVDINDTNSYQVNAFAAVAQSKVQGVDNMKSPNGTNVVAGYFQSNAYANKSNIFGLNSLLADSAGISGVRMSNEFDFNVSNKSTNVSGIRLYLNGITPANANGVIIDKVGSTLWGTGFITQNGSAYRGLRLGSQSDTGDSSSQELVLTSLNNSKEVNSKFQTSSSGAVILKVGGNDQPFVVQDFNNDNGKNIVEMGNLNFRLFPAQNSNEKDIFKVSNNGDVIINGNLKVNGIKNFSIPYPGNKNLTLNHSSLEGPEVGVYYRGEVTLTNNEATIILPEYFESLTEKNNRTIQLTVRGSSPFIVSAGDIIDGKFRIYGTKDGVVDWQVNAIRKTDKPYDIVKEN